MSAVDAGASVRVERRGAVAVLTVDRPDVRNALTDETLAALTSLAVACDADGDVRCLVIAGSEKVFASGADVRALLERDPVEVYDGDRARLWDQLRALRTPVVAAVSGFCLGGGFELAMMSDVVVAAPTSRFGLPETQLGLIPGAGGTQMLPRAVGKALAMDMILTGRMLDADQALVVGLVSRVAEDWLGEALIAAERIAARPAVAQRRAKDAVNTSFDVGLAAGVEVERRTFAMVFATEDAREGMQAFVDKRDPSWRHA